MEKFKFKSMYSMIVLSWCIGYPSKEEMVKFLRKCKAQLDIDEKSTTRGTSPTAAIVVIDTYFKDAIYSKIEEFGQTIRNPEATEALFEEAGLIVHKRIGERELPGSLHPMMVWALI